MIPDGDGGNRINKSPISVGNLGRYVVIQRGKLEEIKGLKQLWKTFFNSAHNNGHKKAGA
jgi:hypothetical protein